MALNNGVWAAKFGRYKRPALIIEIQRKLPGNFAAFNVPLQSFNASDNHLSRPISVKFSIPSALAMEILKSCTKPTACTLYIFHYDVIAMHFLKIYRCL